MMANKSLERLLRYVAQPWVFAVLCAAIVGLCFGWGYFIRWRIPDWGHRGLFGDMFGSLNTLFTGLAFAGLAYTIVFQKVESLDNEAERSEQRALSEKQSFEATFFQLLGSWNQVVESLEIHEMPGDLNSLAIRGREALSVLAKAYRPYYSKSAHYLPVAKDQHLEVINEAYKEFYSKYNYTLGHYSRTLYHLFKYIDTFEGKVFMNADLSAVWDRIRYAHIARAHLSDAQELLLFYNCLSEYGSEKFKPLVEKYALLKHVRVDELMDPKHRDLYAPSAFEQRELL